MVWSAAVAGGCDASSSAPPSPCTAPLLRGVLEPLGREGLGIFVGDRHLEVDWPDGFSALSVGGRLSLVDSSGQVLAGVGDDVELHGRESQPGTVTACGSPVLTVFGGAS